MAFRYCRHPSNSSLIEPSSDVPVFKATLVPCFLEAEHSLGRGLADANAVQVRVELVHAIT